MVYLRSKKEYVNIPPQGLLMSELSDIIKASYQCEVTEENIESFTDDYISNAEKVTNEVEIPYTYKDGIYSAEYDLSLIHILF